MAGIPVGGLAQDISLPPPRWAEPPRASPAEFVEGLNRTLKIVAAASDNDPQSSLYWRFGRIR